MNCEDKLTKTSLEIRNEMPFKKLKQDGELNKNYVKDKDEMLNKASQEDLESQIENEEDLRQARELTHLDYDDTMNMPEDLSSDEDEEGNKEF